jgi:hypothetical protein
MACELVSTRGAVFALWGRPTVRDIDLVLRAIQACADGSRHPVVFVARVPAGAPSPDAKARARLSELMPQLLASISTYHAVVEGDGFSVAMKRGILTGAFQLCWRRSTFFVHSKVEQVLTNVVLEQRENVTCLLTIAKERGFLKASLEDRSSTLAAW